MKLKWNVEPAASGRFRGFQKRGWPNATIPGDNQIVARIVCSDSYNPEAVRTGQHGELSVRVIQWNHNRQPHESAFEWRTLKTRFATLPEAKAAAEAFLNTNPTFLPPSENK